MTTQKTSRTQPMVLTNAQIKKCNEIKDSQQGLAQKRAITLLLIHVGNSYSQAAEQSGLTLGQVRYLVTAFRRRGLSVFDTESKPATSKTVTKKAPAAKKAATKKAPAAKAATKKAPEAKAVAKKPVAAKPAAEKVEAEVEVVASENTKVENEKPNKKDKKKLKKVKDKTAKKDNKSKKDKKDKKKGKKKKSK